MPSSHWAALPPGRDLWPGFNVTAWRSLQRVWQSYRDSSLLGIQEMVCANAGLGCWATSNASGVGQFSNVMEQGSDLRGARV